MILVTYCAAKYLHWNMIRRVYKYLPSKLSSAIITKSDYKLYESLEPTSSDTTCIRISEYQKPRKSQAHCFSLPNPLPVLNPVRCLSTATDHFQVRYEQGTVQYLLPFAVPLRDIYETLHVVSICGVGYPAGILNSRHACNPIQHSSSRHP